MTNNQSALHKALSQVIGAERTERLFQVLTIPQGILNESGDSLSRAGIAQALNMLLFEDLLARVPDARTQWGGRDSADLGGRAHTQRAETRGRRRGWVSEAGGGVSVSGKGKWERRGGARV